MKKKIVLTVLAVVLLLGCGFGAWMYFQQPESTESNDWIEAQIRRSQTDALSEHGYYYVPFAEKNAIHYMDFASGNSTVLCYKPTCQHDSRDCDAFLLGMGDSKMFYYQGNLYYADQKGSALYRRDATGLSLAEVGTPGKQFVKDQKAVGFGVYVPMDDWMYYSGTVSSIAESGVNLTEMTYIGRLNLTNGKDEVLVEDPASRLIVLAARSGSVLFARWEVGELDSSDPDYSEQFRNLKVSAEIYDTETGNITVLFQKTRRECQEIHLVYNNKIYYANYPLGGFTNTFVYDMETGEDTLCFENTMLRHLGGGYAFSKEGPDAVYKLININTRETLPFDSADGTPFSGTKSDKGVVLWYVGVPQADGSELTSWCYVPYAALADGLQKTDLIVANSRRQEPTPPNDATTPTQPSNGDVTGLESLFPALSFDNRERIADEDLELSIQYLPETVENPQGLPVLKWVCLEANASKIWTEDAVREANQTLERKNMPFRLQFVMISANCSDTEADFFSRVAVKEALKDADLICYSMTAKEQQEYLMAITDYVTGDAQPSLRNAAPHALDWLRTTVGNEIYGIPSYPSQAAWNAWMVKPSVLEDMGLTVEDFQRDYWEMDEIFAKIYEKNGKQPFLRAVLNEDINTLGYRVKIRPGLPETMGSAMELDYQQIGMHYVIDRSADSPKVVSILETEVGRKIWEADMRYKKAGYIEYSFEKCLVMYSGSRTDKVNTAEVYGDVVIPFGKAFYTGVNVDSAPTVGILATAQQKEAALTLLCLIAEDEAFRDQLCFGKEGRDYQYAQESGPFGSYPVIKRENDAYYNMEFLSPYAPYYSEVTKDIYPWVYPNIEGQTRLETSREALDKVEILHYPVTFDLTGYEEEMEQIGKILGMYYRILNNTEEYKIKNITVPPMTPELYDQMLQELKEAGSEAVEAELQRQLDEWLAANPDWQ